MQAHYRRLLTRLCAANILFRDPEGLEELFTLIPMYMPVKIAVAVGKRGRDLDDFHRELLQFKTFTDSIKHDYTAFLKEAAGTVSEQHTCTVHVP